MISGFINIDKPAGITSHDVIFRLRRSTKIKRMGHTGTLDPDATGVLPVAIGPACRLIDYLSKDKVYFAEILLGTRTNTDDLSGRVLETKEVDSSVNSAKINEILQTFTGSIQQIPPLYSAVHHNGQRLHHIARVSKNRNANVADIATVLSAVKQREVQIEKIDLIGVALPILSLRITCSAGTYIRSLARDLGELLGCGACLKFLRREKSGSFELCQSTDLDTALRLIGQGELAQLLVNPLDVLKFKTVKLDSEAIALILNGRYLDFADLLAYKSVAGKNLNAALEIERLDTHETVMLLADSENVSHVIGLGSVGPNRYIKPEVVLLNAAALKI